VRPIVTPEEMAACDADTIAAGTPGDVLMDRAGAAVATSALRIMGGAYGKRVEILCGRGNNGGDGVAAARHLAARGAAPRLALLDEPERFSPDAASHFRRLAGLAIPVRHEPRLDDADLVIDAMAGTGFSGALRGNAAEWAYAVNASPVPVLAVDVPSGVPGATGTVDGPAVIADHTVTMAALKVGLVYGGGVARAGAVEVADIGISVPLERASWRALDHGDAVSMLPRRLQNTHKWEVGSVLVVAGSAGMSGAGILTASTALRAGVGVVVLAVPDDVRPHLEGHADLTEVMTASLDDIPELMARFGVIAVGPGLRRGDDQRKLVELVLQTASQPVVVDADGLNNIDAEVFAERAVPRPAAVGRPPHRRVTVITPHEGELSRLVHGPVDRPVHQPLDLVPRLATEWGVVLLLKGASTLVASPDGARYLNTTGTPELATAGTGDVLTGLIAAFLARGCPPAEGTAAAAFVHGLAGRGAHRAGDVRDRLSEVMA